MSAIVEHALNNVWISPSEDLQIIFKPAKLTATYIKTPYFSLMWDNIPPPNNSDYFQYYQIGHLGPTFIGLLDKGNVWTLFSIGCQDNNLIVDLYSDKGIQLPRFQSWYMILDQKNILIAIKKYPSINFNPDTEDLYIRFYRNAFFNLAEATNVGSITVNGIHVSQPSDIIQIQNEYNYYSTLPGKCSAYRNGYLVTSITLINTKVGDVIEYVYDPSIYTQLALKLSDLPIFTSSLDSTIKYLVHHNGPTPRGIDFQQDVDFYLVNKSSDPVGVLYHKNLNNAVRMVTHSDYAIPTMLVENLLSRQSWNDPSTIYLYLNIRKSGTNRPLIFEKNEINELYKLPEDKILQALSGLNATVPNWTATNLEASAYTGIMHSNYIDVTKELVTDAYGYHGIAKAIADTPSLPIPNSTPPTFTVPPALVENFTAVEYDASGLLLGFYTPIDSGAQYIAENPTTGYVEFLKGLPANYPWEIYEFDTDILPGIEFRAYLCQKVDGVPNNVWVDVTGSGMYSFINNHFTWLFDKSEYFGMVRTNQLNMYHEDLLTYSGGVLTYTLHHYSYRNEQYLDRVMDIPMNQLTVFLNGRILIENLDYRVEFPKIYITNKEYLIGDANAYQKINILFTGLCATDFSREINSDTGFINHGLLSYNNKYDLRDNKVLRIAVGGKLKSRSDLLFAENDSGVTVPNAINGLPYSITEIIVPLYNEATRTTDVLRNEATVIDNAVSSYLTSITPEPIFTTPNPIQNQHTLYSPFLSKIIFDLANNILVDPRLTQNYSDPDVRDMCVNYTYLLAFDPAQAPNLPDMNYVIIHPHVASTVISLDVFKYRFVLRVLKVFFNDRLSISGFVNLV